MEFLEKYKRWILIVVTILLVVTIIVTFRNRTEATFVGNSVGYVVTPVQKYLGAAGKWISEQVEFLQNIKNLQEQNQELLLRVEELEAENKKLHMYEKENEQLTSLLELDKKYPDYPKVGARVIGKDPGNWYNVFLIDKGTQDGLEADMMVMGNGGLVGRIIEAGTNYSKVLSIIDDRSSVSAMILRTNDVGIVKGDHVLMNDGMCKMEYVNAEAEIVLGDEVITSHLGDVYPPGIIIGTVKEIKTESHGLTKYALIEPAADFRHLEHVIVVNKKLKDLKKLMEE